MLSRIRQLFIGKPINPMQSGAREGIALATLLAWVGLGADAISSSCYGPAEAYVALGSHSHFALFVAVITILTIFIISLGYNQVIELFPNGGGGYQVATKLLHPYVGLVSGAALLVDYALTISVSIASGTDAIFSFLPGSYSTYKIYAATLLIVLLLIVNLRGMKESIQILMPIFIGFIITHIALITYGVVSHAAGLYVVIPNTLRETTELARALGWVSIIGIVLHAYSLGSGTYTGLEAVSNNVQRLKEPRVQTGKNTMLLMALSLSLISGGMILLYLLWNAVPIPGRTLNASVFSSILGDSWIGQAVLILTLELEAGLLIVAANAGFLAGPYVLANMAGDKWMPTQFGHFSNRLVVQNAVILFGVVALFLLYWTNGNVSTLVVLYSINVFITFSLSLLAISVYWIKHRASRAWLWHLAISGTACLVTTTILIVTLYFKFTSGGWLTILLTSSVVLLAILIRSHYDYVERKLASFEGLLVQPVSGADISPHAIDPHNPTAIIFINNYSVGMHTLLSILRIFPDNSKTLFL